jgi:hypothetical protein
MNYFILIMRLMPFVSTLVEIAEKLFDDKPDSGAEKKAMVMAVVKGLVNIMIGVSTGGQQETWKKLEPLISQLVDAICAVLFPHDEVV